MSYYLARKNRIARVGFLGEILPPRKHSEIKKHENAMKPYLEYNTRFIGRVKLIP